MKIKVMKHAVLLCGISVVLLLAGLLVLVFKGFNLGIDFTGGSILNITFDESFELNKVEDVFKASGMNVGDYQFSLSGDNQVVLRYQDKDADPEEQNTKRTAFIDALQEVYPTADQGSLDRVGAVAGAELRKNAFTAVAVACVLMLLYIWIRFEFLSGLTAVIALLHDVMMMVAVMAVTRTQVDSTFIAAMLTIVGYSINNTIIIFDRVRENKRRSRRMSNEELVDESINSCLSRTINTTVTTLFTVLALYIFGVTSIKIFTLPLLVGIVSGLYSSLFIAGPVWVWLHRIGKHGKAKKGAKGGEAKAKTAKA
ncbi:MAG: protein translocase subunit SecF [Eubacteriales bacterium]|nr:protein translocase subunit SecF [Eubacteriales bacterium]